MTNLRDLPLSHSRPSDTLLDVMTYLRISSQILSEGGITDEYAAEISWLLGSFKKRLEPVMDLVERLEDAGTIDVTPEEFRPDLPAAAIRGSAEAPGDGALATESEALAPMTVLGLEDPKAMLKAVKAEKARRETLKQAQEDLAIVDEINAARAKLDAIRNEVKA